MSAIAKLVLGRAVVEEWPLMYGTRDAFLKVVQFGSVLLLKAHL